MNRTTLPVIVAAAVFCGAALHAAPTPDPMTFDVVPAAVNETKVTMTASLATDPNGVEYFFTETSGSTGGDDSGWQASPTYTDDGLDPGTLYTYNVKARDAVGFLENVASADESATTDADDGTNPVIYEPFSYTPGGLNGASGPYEIGLDGTWTANSTAMVAASSLAWGTLPTQGGSIGGLSGSQNRFGGARAVSSSALAGNGLLADGAILWFSVEMGYDTGGNTTNSRLAFSLANSSFNTSNGNYSIADEGPQLGSGFGIVLGGSGVGTGKVAATQFRDSSFGNSGYVLGNLSSALYSEGEHGLLVGKITWGATPGDPDTFELFNPDTSLAFPDPGTPISTLSVTVDQSTFDTITWGRGDKVVMDEIRFGASYNDVIAADLVTTPDLVAPTPEPMSFATAPTAIDDSQITMTATVANDPSGVEYYFDETSGNPGGSDSGWQSSPTYVNTGLTPSTLYTYTVQARDKSVANNMNTASAAESTTTPAVDTVAPTPDPMTFASNPTAISNTEITMTASTATDDTYGVEYYFTNTAGGGNDSGWQSSDTYTDSGLTPSTLYTYTVTARDTGPLLNEGGASGAESTSTLPTDGTPPSPNTWATAPIATSHTEITMTATTATDDQYSVEYYFANRSVIDGSHDSGWQASPTYNDTGLNAFQSYTYQVTVRDTSYAQNETAGSDSLPAVTDADPSVTAPSLIEGQFYFVGSQNNGGTDFDVSVFPGAARYSGTTTPVGPVYSHFGDGTPLDYRFFRDSSGSIVSYADGGTGIVGTASGTGTGNRDYADAWTTLDPGYDFTANSPDVTSQTMARAASITGTVDISGMSEGILYFVYGSYRSRPGIDLTMSGSGQSDVTLDDAGDNDSANNSENYVVAVNFLNAEDYDTISYTFSAGNGWLMGVVVDGESVPTGTDYGNWADGFGLTDGDADPSLDYDLGGLETGIEWVVGGDPSDASDDAGLAPTATEDGTYLIYTYIRTDEANDDTNNTAIKVEYGSTLTGWTDAQNGVDNVIITETDLDPGVTDTVEVKIPKALAVGGKLFARLNVVIAP